MIEFEKMLSFISGISDREITLSLKLFREFAIKNWSIPRMPCLFVFEDIQKPDRYHLNIPLK